MFQISAQVKYTHNEKKAAILFYQTKYMTYKYKQRLFSSIHVSGHGHTCIYVNWFQRYSEKINFRQWLPN